MYTVVGEHRVISTNDPACEIYPGVFVVKGRGGVLSPYSGLAQFGPPCEPLPEGTQIVFDISEKQLEEAIQYAEAIHRPSFLERRQSRRRPPDLHRF
ncbi:hypothetical protein, partial [Rhodococcus phenolicus]|uniref:hypothetical protein n=1 Tax=Rhodococcus phenolicus TaxID=263849 RepID=UPI001B805BCC